MASWVNRYRASPLGLRRFAEKNGISINRLRHWVYGKGKSKSVKLDAAAPVFEEIKLTGLPLQSWAAEVSLPSGLAVRFSAAATPAWIGSVVKGLPRRCGCLPYGTELVVLRASSCSELLSLVPLTSQGLQI